MKSIKNKLCLIVMAAGVSKRYGNENKLLESFNGERLIDIVVDIIPNNFFESIIAVTSDNDVSKAFKDKNIKTITNQNPERGAGSTIKLGLNYSNNNCDGYMFLVCDQPFLSKKTITELVDFWHQNTSSICALAHDTKMGNPVIFPGSLFNQLCKISDNQNGKVVIDNNRSLLKKYDIKNAIELFDIDTVSDLKQATTHITKL